MNTTSEIHTHITVKMPSLCHKYLNVCLLKGDQHYRGQVVSYLSLQDWCELNGYTICEGGIPFYCDPGTATKLEESKF